MAEYRVELDDEYVDGMEGPVRQVSCCQTRSILDHVAYAIDDNENNTPKEENVSDFVNINCDILSQRIHKTNYFTLLAFSKIRQSFFLTVDWNHKNAGLPLKIYVDLASLFNNERAKRVYLVNIYDINDDQTFILYLKSALKKIWNVHNCIHCKTLIFEDESVCQNCELLTCLTYKDNQCIICQESIHPIIYRCETCVDSQICSMCEVNREKKKECAICHVSKIKSRRTSYVLNE
jgi:hypothetical protein